MNTLLFSFNALKIFDKILGIIIDSVEEQIIEKILSSDWHKIQNGENIKMPVKTKISEKQRLKAELKELDKKIAEEEKKINQEQPLTTMLPNIT